MLNRFALFRERGWVEISAADYAACWRKYGGSVATHPEFVERLSRLAEMPTRYLGWQRGHELAAALPVWGRYLALSRKALQASGKKRLFDLGNAEIILPAALPAASPNPVSGNLPKIPLRHVARYLSLKRETVFSGLVPQKERLAFLKKPGDFSAKFRYNQRRLVRQLEEAGCAIRPIRDFAPSELAAIYLDLFQRRWNFPAAGAERMAEVFTLLGDWMTGFVFCMNDAPIAMQVIYRVESPEWISVEYINGGFDPVLTGFSPGSALIYLNTTAAQEEARQAGKELRYSFGRAEHGYKELWCRPETVFSAG